MDKAKLEEVFRDSITPYEKGLVNEFGEDVVTLEFINWLRWKEFVDCLGDPVQRRREYPCRPEEAFEAAAETILDPNVLAKWEMESKAMEPVTGDFKIEESSAGELKVEFEIDELLGRTTIWEMPEDGAEYTMGVDPAGGTKEGDWFVALVLRVDTGAQVAELRTRMDPDQATNQTEALGIFYNSAFSVIEANSFGLAVVREITDRGTLPMFEREIPDRREPGKVTPKIGWLTDARTRNNLLSEVRRCVRDDKCPLRSLVSIREGRTLTVTRTQAGVEKIEARANCHDDGIFAYGMALIGRNRMLPADPMVEGRPKPEVSEAVQAFLDSVGTKAPQHVRRLPMSRTTKHIHGRTILVDGRRSIL